MPKKGKGNTDEFFRLGGELTLRAFLDAVDGDEELANEALLQFAQEHLAEGEHPKIAEIQANEPKRFARIVFNMSLENPDNLVSFLDCTRKAYDEFSRKGTEGTQSGSPERR